MGRPKEHGKATRKVLLAEAERLIDEGGPDALSLRAVADEAGTTTRAVYSLFGSKDGLMVAVAMQAFAYLTTGMKRSPETDDPAVDLINMGTKMYRRFVRKHRAVYRLAFQRIAPGLPLGPEFFEARAKTWKLLEAKVGRLGEAGLLGTRSVTQAAVEFNVVCEGLANAELRGGTMLPGDQEEVWRNTLTVMVRGFAGA